MKTKYTQKEVERFLVHSNAIEDVCDVASLEQAEKAWAYLSKCKTLTSKNVLTTHKILMENQGLTPDQRGYYRRVPVWVGRHEGLAFDQISMAIDSWLEDVKTSIKIPGENGEHIRLDHITYEGIHPFVDGNGRTGRMFMNWQRMMAGLPILIILEEERYAYYQWFKK